jgi:hypothetical protein
MALGLLARLGAKIGIGSSVRIKKIISSSVDYFNSNKSNEDFEKRKKNLTHALTDYQQFYTKSEGTLYNSGIELPNFSDKTGDEIKKIIDKSNVFVTKALKFAPTGTGKDALKILKSIYDCPAVLIESLGEDVSERKKNKKKIESISLPKVLKNSYEKLTQGDVKTKAECLVTKFGELLKAFKDRKQEVVVAEVPKKETNKRLITEVKGFANAIIELRKAETDNFKDYPSKSEVIGLLQGIKGSKELTENQRELAVKLLETFSKKKGIFDKIISNLAKKALDNISISKLK